MAQEKTNYAVCHMQRGSGNDSGMSTHIERRTNDGKVYVPANANRNRTHLNRELIKFPSGVKNRTEAIQHRIDNAGLHRKVGKNQTKAVRVILTGTHERMIELERQGRLDDWISANLKWLNETFGEDNVVSCVLHMDEKTPHLHATIVPIVNAPRKRRQREGEKKNRVKTGPRLSADDLMSRYNLKKYQDSYGKAMKEFGLERGIVGSTAKHIVNSDYYKMQINKYEEDIATLQAEVEKAKEGKSTILALFGKGDLAKAKKMVADKDKKIAELEQKINVLESEKVQLKAEHEAEMSRFKNGYQREINIAIAKAERLGNEVKSLSKELSNVKEGFDNRLEFSLNATKKELEQSHQDQITHLKNEHKRELSTVNDKVETLQSDIKLKNAEIQSLKEKNIELDKIVHPQRYFLSSGAELVHYFIPNFNINPTIRIWTKVGEETFDDFKFIKTYSPTWEAFLKDEATVFELINDVFPPEEQVNEAQARLLGAAFMLASGGPAQPHVGTGGGGGSDDTWWKKKDKNNRGFHR